AETRFFTPGGTLSRSASSYIVREADEQLFEALIAGRYCFLLNSRQMGKSSLSVRTMARLREVGVQSVLVDLTRIGGKNVTADQWYATLCREIAISAGLKLDFKSYWLGNPSISPMRKFFQFLREHVLGAIEGNFVLFIDEVDAARNLSFSADEFFAGIREMYNRRSDDVEFSRITFCLVGVALPADLVSDPRITPFNIGERIYLQDFTQPELSAYIPALGSNGQAVVERIYFWTSGHPYLTQSLCAALAECPSAATVSDVDQIVDKVLLRPSARETNLNLTDVGNRVLNSGTDQPDPDAFKAEILTTLETLARGREVVDNEANRACAILKLSGLVRSLEGRLAIRNRIYERVFDRKWIRENLPQQEVRRQKRAYLRGLLLAGSVGGVVVCSIVGLALTSLFLANVAKKNEAAARSAAAKERVARLESDRLRQQMETFSFQSYVLTMQNTLADYLAGRDGAAMRELSELEQQPERGWELSYLSHQIHRLGRYFKASEVRVTGLCFTSAGQLVTLAIDGTLTVWDGKSLAVVRRFTVPSDSFALEVPKSGEFAIVARHEGTTFRISLRDGKVAWTQPRLVTSLGGTAMSQAGNVVMAYGDNIRGEIAACSTQDGRILNKVSESNYYLENAAVSPDGSRFAVSGLRLKSTTLHDTCVSGFFVGRPKPAWERRSVEAERAMSLCYASDGRSINAGLLAGGVLSLDADGIEKPSSFGVGVHQVLYAQPLDDVNHRRLVIGAQAIQIQDAGTHKVLAGRNPSDQVWRLTLSQDRQTLATTGLDGSVYLWNLRPDGDSRKQQSTRRDRLVAQIPGLYWHGSYLSHDCSMVGLLQENSRTDDHWKAKLVRLADSKTLKSSTWTSPFRFSGSDKLVAIAHEFESTVYSLPGWKPLMKLPGRSVVAFSHDEKKILAVSSSPITNSLRGEVEVLELATSKSLVRLMVSQSELISGCFSLGDRQIAVGGDDHRIWIVDISSGKVTRVLDGHSNDPTVLQFLPDGKKLISSANDSTTRIWNLETGKPIHVLTEPDIGRYGASDMTLLKGGRRIAVTSRGGISIWDLATGRLALHLAIPQEPLCTEQLSNGDLLTVCANGDVLRLETEAVPAARADLEVN
ncbi:MAG TPA: AAA-like domain-containing protein, partial [Fimbriimonas sp.]|nr:AAA-like domain-containing protein [Fimbriimonas sp.]